MGLEFVVARSNRVAASNGADAAARLLDAAETIFAERGYRASSIRAITRAAGLSVSAANYHFGSKAELMRAVLRRRVAPVNAERERALAAIEARCGAQAPPLDDVLRAFLSPMLRAGDAERAPYRHVVARLHSDPPELVVRMRDELFGPISERMIGLLERALPGHPSQRVALALQFSVGAMVHAVGGQIALATGIDPESTSDDEVLDRLVEFCAAGVHALLGGAEPARRADPGASDGSAGPVTA